MSKKIIIILSGLGILVFLISIGFVINADRKLKKLKTVEQSNNPTPKADELTNLVEEVGKLMILPANETPTLATVTDVEKLRLSQPFFNIAENGDKLLIYAGAKKAILYRPSLGKVVDIGPVSVNPNQTGAVATGQNITPAPTTSLVKVSVYNGTKTAGLAKTVAKQLTNDSEIGLKIKIVSTANSKGDYVKTLVVDLSGSRTELAGEIAGLLSGIIGLLPDGETKPSADILVIVGK